MGANSQRASGLYLQAENNLAKQLSSTHQIQFEDLAPDPIMELETPSNFKKQHLEAHFSSKGRAGRIVTLIKGFEGSKEALKDLAKQLKTQLKVGGSVKDNTILIQGDHRDQIIEFLVGLGHHVKRVGG